MSATELKDALLLFVVDTDSEATAIQNWFDAVDTYAAPAVGNGVPFQRLIADGVQMKAAMVGMSAAGQGAAKIAAGITAYWAQAVSTPSASFAGALSATIPTGLGALAANLQAVFASNANANLSVDAALTAVANVIHTACQGGTVTLPPSNVGAIV